MQTKQLFTSFYYYLPSFIFGLIALYAINAQKITFYYLPLFSFGVIPLIELIIPQKSESCQVSNPFLNSLLTVLIVPFHFYILLKFLSFISQNELNLTEFIGAVLSMGILCGVYGINVAHELGHRNEKWKQHLAKLLLLTSLYMHFFIEHNRGHHKNVATLKDPATARKNESIYAFWIRCIFQSFNNAFRLEKHRLLRENKRWLCLKNIYLQFLLIQVITLFLIFSIFGFNALLFFILSASVGILLLETINYVEHYGLLRKEISPNVFERVNETHSWNSDHVLGRYLLFELTRHSHHHENSQREYFELESIEKSSQLPTGYPGMILLSFIPPLFFKIMNRRLP